jgi:DNA-binding NtrC family response regulator
MAHLLILEDDRITALALQRAVTRMGHTVVARTASAAEALAAVQAHHPDGVLLDLHLRGPRDGLLVGTDIQALWSTPVIYLTGSDPAQLGMPDVPDALWCYVAKPVDWDQLREILARLFPMHPPRPRVPWSGLEDAPHPIRLPTQELREQLRQLRQPVGTFSRQGCTGGSMDGRHGRAGRFTHWFD